ncbi:MAG: transcriptional repressor [Pseudomonadota bacterium]
MSAENQPFEAHDHGGCVSRVSDAVEEACREQGLRLTPIRRSVLEILLEEHKALGAYDVLTRLADAGRPAHPPVAYRALDFLVANGFAHKIERLNAFVACLHPDGGHCPAFLICRECRVVAEADVPLGEGTLGRAAEGLGFRLEGAVIEAEGLCPACVGAAAT